MSAEVAPVGGGFQVLTSAGPAAIAVIRLWGAHTEDFVKRHIRSSRARRAGQWVTGEVLRAALVDAHGAPLDDILVSVHAPTPELDLRLHLHGNPALVRRCGDWLRDCGLLELPESGAALWPTKDVLEAEAWALLPRVLTVCGAQWLLAQVGRLRTAVSEMLNNPAPEVARQRCAEIAGRVAIIDWFTRPLRVVLAGPPNVGKSTLANALADRVVSIVAPTPGTTRDWVEVPGEAQGFPVLWLDTAGLRESADALERAGIERTQRLMRAADAVVIVLDVTEQVGPAQVGFVNAYGDVAVACVALNKVDVAEPPAALRESLPWNWQDRLVRISAAERRGLAELCKTLLANLGRTAPCLDLPAAFTGRQAALLLEATSARDRNVVRAKLLQTLDDPEVTVAPRSG